MARTQIATLKGPRGYTGPRGLPGLNAVPTDQGIGTLVDATDSQTGIAVRGAATDVWKAQAVAPSNAPYVQLSPAVGALSSGGNGILALKSNAAASTDDGTRIYVMPRGKVTSSVGGTIKLFGDPFFDNNAYRDLGIYFSADQNSDTGNHGTGVFWINSKVGTALGSSSGGEYSGKNPDIGFSFQDYVVAARFSLLGPANPVFIVGAGPADVSKRSPTVRLEMKGDLAFQGTSRVLRWESEASVAADNLMAFEADQLRLVLKGATQLTAKSNGSIVMGGGSGILTTATDGFFYMRAMAGTPTGTPTAQAGTVPLVVDNTAGKLWARIAGVWKSVTFA